MEGSKLVAALLFSGCLALAEEQVLAGLRPKTKSAAGDFGSQDSPRYEHFKQQNPQYTSTSLHLPALAGYVQFSKRVSKLQFCLENNAVLQQGEGGRHFAVAVWAPKDTWHRFITAYASSYDLECNVPVPSNNCARSSNLILAGLLQLPAYGSSNPLEEDADNSSGKVGIAVIWVPLSCFSVVETPGSEEATGLLVRLKESARAAINFCRNNIKKLSMDKPIFLLCLDEYLKENFSEHHSALAAKLLLSGDQKFGAICEVHGGLVILPVSVKYIEPPENAKAEISHGKRVATWKLILVPEAHAM